MASLSVEFDPASGDVSRNGAGGGFFARPGDCIRGSVVIRTAPTKDLTLSDAGLSVTLTGSEQVWVSGQSQADLSNTQYHTEEFCKLQSLPLMPRRETTLPKGNDTRVPFTFDVPHASPSSINTTFGRSKDDEWDAYSGPTHQAVLRVSYAIRVTAFVSGIFSSNLNTVAAFSVVHPQKQKPQIPAEAAEPRFESKDVTGGGFMCFGNTCLSASITIPKSVVSNGELLPVLLSIDNAESTAAIKSISFALQTGYTMHCASDDTYDVTRYKNVALCRTALRVPGKEEKLLPVKIPLSGLEHQSTRGKNFSMKTYLCVVVMTHAHSEPLSLRLPLYLREGGE